MRKELIVIGIGVIVSLIIVVTALIQSRDDQDGSARLSVSATQIAPAIS